MSSNVTELALSIGEEYTAAQIDELTTYLGFIKHGMLNATKDAAGVTLKDAEPKPQKAAATAKATAKSDDPDSF